MRVYFDNAATTAIDPEVLDVMFEMMGKEFGNPSSIHSHGRQSRTIIERARKSVAEVLNTSASEVFFTSGGTEADNTAIRCGIASKNIRHAITSRIEHHAVLHTLEAMAREGTIELSYIENDRKGNYNVDHLKALLQSKPGCFVSLMHANNEIATINDIAQIADLCKHHNSVFHSDTVQTVGHYPIDLQKVKADFIACAGHKFHGPKGIGFLYVNHSMKINPLLYGGSQERNMRGGTENLHGIVGLAKALEIAVAGMESHHHYIQSLKSYMIDRLKTSIPGIEFNGEVDPDKSLYTVLNVLFPETELADMLLFKLDIAGISVSGGSACSSGTDIGSHVLNEIGSNPARPAVRFSFSKFNTRKEVDFVVETLAELF